MQKAGGLKESGCEAAQHLEWVALCKAWKKFSLCFLKGSGIAALNGAGVYKRVLTRAYKN